MRAQARPNIVKISERKTKLHKVRPTPCRVDSWGKMPKKAALVVGSNCDSSTKRTGELSNVPYC